MASLEDPFDYTQPTQPFEEATQATQDDTSQITSHQKPVGKLVWKHRDQNLDHDIFLDSAVVIGRHRSCSIQVSSGVSSNMHCRISATFDRESADYLVSCDDLSSNGTYWNGKRIGKGRTVILWHGDVLEIKKGHYFTYLRMARIQKNGGAEGDAEEVKQLEGKYQITDTVLGKGTFAEIRLAYKKDTQKSMAVKIMSKKKFSTNGSAGGGTNIIHEISLLRGIKHPNIVRVFDVAETSKHVYIFMPVLRGGDLFDCVLDRDGLSEDEAKFAVYQMLLALKYLHDANIAHRDLKPENVLLVSKDPYSQVMLTDFGMAKATGQQELMKTMCGTLQYIAPEMISPGVSPGEKVTNGYTTAVDCWSLGVMVYAMVSCAMPFIDDEPRILFEQIRAGRLDFTDTQWSSISFECQMFIQALCRVDPAKRMTVNGAFKHPWIARDEPRLAKLYTECTRSESSSSGAQSPPTEPESRPIAANPPQPAAKHPAPSDDDGDTGAMPMGPPPPKRPRQP
ncbi:hypothetical protein GGF46_000486 [Coemansia sp. RSA 552]|nr:hypothetical protein GGF46_000486 [Coemansia sp. RSA 552]